MDYGNYEKEVIDLGVESDDREFITYSRASMKEVLKIMQREANLAYWEGRKHQINFPLTAEGIVEGQRYDGIDS